MIEEARRKVASAINCTARRMVFTGCGSESNNLAIKGAAFARADGKRHLITSQVEHPAVLETCEWLSRNGYDVTFLGVGQDGIVDPADMERAITPKTFLASIMAANNETGSLQPVKELAEIARGHGILFHCDATQAVGKIPVNVEDWGVDMLTISAHKFHGPKGVGALYVRKGVKLESLVSGGEQEGGLRAGTENIIGIVGFGRAAGLVPGLLSKMTAVMELRDMLENGIRAIVPEARLNGHHSKRLSNTLNMTLPGFRGESMVMAMSQRGVYFSSGSACSSGSPDPSRSLLAMGLSEADAHCALRFSLGYRNTEEEITHTLELLKKTIEDSKNVVRFVPCR